MDTRNCRCWLFTICLPLLDIGFKQSVWEGRVYNVRYEVQGKLIAINSHFNRHLFNLCCTTFSHCFLRLSSASVFPSSPPLFILFLLHVFFSQFLVLCFLPLTSIYLVLLVAFLPQLVSDGLGSIQVVLAGSDIVRLITNSEPLNFECWGSS